MQAPPNSGFAEVAIFDATDMITKGPTSGRRSGFNATGASKSRLSPVLSTINRDQRHTFWPIARPCRRGGLCRQTLTALSPSSDSPLKRRLLCLDRALPYSSRVDRSPSSWPSARARRTLRRILPERVFGRPSTNSMSSGLAMGERCWATWPLISSVRSRSPL